MDSVQAETGHGSCVGQLSYPSDPRASRAVGVDRAPTGKDRNPTPITSLGLLAYIADLAATRQPMPTRGALSERFRMGRDAIRHRLVHLERSGLVRYETDRSGKHGRKVRAQIVSTGLWTGWSIEENQRRAYEDPDALLTRLLAGKRYDDPAMYGVAR